MKISQLSNDRRPVIAAIVAMLCFCVFSAGSLTAQDASDSVVAAPVRYRVGEKLTYNVSFGKFTNAAYLEMSVISSGKLSGLDAVDVFEIIAQLFGLFERQSDDLVAQILRTRGKLALYRIS